MKRIKDIIYYIEELTRRTQSGKFKWGEQSPAVYYMKKGLLQINLQRKRSTTGRFREGGEYMLILYNKQDGEVLLNVDSRTGPDIHEKLEILFFTLEEMAERRGIDAFRSFLEDN